MQITLKKRLNMLLANMTNDKKYGSLNFCYDIREGILPYLHLVRTEDRLKLERLHYLDIADYIETLDLGDTYHLLIYCFLICNYSVKYVEHFLPNVRSRSLKAALDLCFSRAMIFNLDHSDPELDVLSDIFNNINLSSRKNLHCYDCGTSARGVFFNLIKANRGTFYLNSEEIFQLRREYYFTAPDRFSSLRILLKDLRSTDKNSVFIMGIKFGENLFGHIMVAELEVLENSRRVRFYQSALNSYLLIDYIAKMKYLENENKGINLRLFEKDMTAVMKVSSWSAREDAIFAKWFAFWPQDKITDTSTMRFHHARIVY